MKTVKIAGLITILLITIPSCTADDKNTGTSPVILTGFPVVAGNNKFALELYAKLQSQQGNLFLSPYSISTALAMAYAGARDQTEKQIAEALCFSTMRSEYLHEEFGRLIRKLNAAGEKGGYELVVANAIWGQKGYNFLPEYLSLVKTEYDGNLQQVDFAKQLEEARKTINAWVEKKTKDKIKELLKPGMLDKTTRLVLTNAIYFKGKWANQFAPILTKDSPFILLGGQKVNVPMMNQTEKFGYKEDANIQVLEMPYVNNDLSMVVLLPKKLDGINGLEKDLNNDNLAGWTDDLHKRKVQVLFPRFKMASEFELVNVLSSMGMPIAFSDKADFSGMNGNHELSISAVVHKAYVDVNEEGTEAAAATGVGVIATSIEAPPPVFKADHPFIFLIHDNKSGSILFLGRVANPASKDN
jgi:serpin B